MIVLTEWNQPLVRRLVDQAVHAGDLDVLDEIAAGEIADAARRWIGPFHRAGWPQGLVVWRLDGHKRLP